MNPRLSESPPVVFHAPVALVLPLPLVPSVARPFLPRKTVPPPSVSPPLNPPAPRDSDSQLVQRLADSVMFREFQSAFEDSTRLPLTLRGVDSWQLAHTHSKHQNGFCKLMSSASRSCASCLQIQQRVCSSADATPATFSCAFGLNETAVAVKLGLRTIAYLQTGQVFFKRPTAGQTERALRQIKEWGFKLAPGEIVRLYHQSPLVDQNEYEATTRLLRFFANQLGPLATQIVLLLQTAHSSHILRAKKFIQEQYQEKLNLGLVARYVGMSKFHFCKLFKKATGMNFTHYVSRVRIEHARKLLLNPNYRITEIAYSIGFQSLTHFNRIFKNIVGESPSDYRRHLPVVGS